jgi:putative DNA primase/helicase
MNAKEVLQKRLNDAKKRMAWALTSESAKHINAALDLARSEPGIPVLPAQLDRAPWLLNCPNGTLDLRTGRLHAHRREDYITKLCPTEYHPDARCPAWEKFLADIFPATGDAAEEPGDAELIGFIQRKLGQCLTGDVSEQDLTIFWGVGSNGKSVLVNTCLDLLGKDYSMKANQELLTVHRGERHSTERMDLCGKRLVVASETAEGARLNDALVKDLTGGEPIRGRRMREDQWEFSPTHKLILLTNHKPRVAGNDKAMRRRIVLVPFEVFFWNPDDPADVAKGLPQRLRQDKHLVQKLQAERAGILAWMVRGCLEWQKQGLRIPRRVSAVTQEYLDAEDLLRQFLEECCLTGSDNYRCRAGQLHKAYVAWCEGRLETPLKMRSFGEAITERGFRKEPSNGVWYIGVTPREGDEGGRGEATNCTSQRWKSGTVEG